MTPDEDHSEQEPPAGRQTQQLHIVVSDCPDGIEKDVVRAARTTLRSQGFAHGELEIAVVSDAEMRRQHEAWMGDASTTDVLTFDLREAPRKGRVEGQLIVCVSVARRRARLRRADWRGELLLYVVHGCLHLCGMDDHEAEDAAAMHAREDELLSRLGWGPVYSRRPKTPKTGVRR